MRYLVFSVNLPLYKDPPDAIKRLYVESDQSSRNFRENIRSYNGALSLASRQITGNMYRFSSKSRGPPVFKMCGQMYHLLGPVLPENGEKPKFSQLYVYDRQNELGNRIDTQATKEKLDCSTMKVLQENLHNINFYVQQYQQAADILTADPSKELRLIFKAKGSKNVKKQYSLPDVGDVGILAPGDLTEPRDIVLYPSKSAHPSGRATVRINQYHPMYDPTAYVLLFPHGDEGYSLPAPLKVDKMVGKKVTELEFYRYHIMHRSNSFNTILRGGRLFQEYICDMYCKVESSRLRYYRDNQDTLRCEQYSGIIDAIHAANNKDIPEIDRIGKSVILPASHTGSPRYMHGHYLDAMAICREFRKFDLFITVTGNPKWDGITDNLLPGQTASDRPDIQNRVFHEILTALMADITKRHILGPTRAWLYVVEGQMRGLKHAHILLLLAIVLKVTDVDCIINSQIPEKDSDPQLYDAISRFMLHGPCGLAFPKAKCMDKGVCTKGFPKEFKDNTSLPGNGHGYPLYARPDNGRVIDKDGFRFDNRWVVPHNRYMLLKYQCHINVEFIGSFHTVKYVFKYVNKGVDLATMGVKSGPRDEIQEFVNARYIDPHDSVWRIFKFPIQDRHPAVTRLAIHDEGQQNVMFREGQEVEAVEKQVNTTLMAFFVTNKTNPAARHIKYQDFPKHFTFRNGKWNGRKRPYEPGVNQLQTIGRIYSVSPNQGARFYIRLNLNHITGATSFTDLRTYNGTAYGTFKECALAMGLLADDKEWFTAMEETSSHAMPAQMRATFAVLLQYCNITEPRRLWEQFKDRMAEDLVFHETKQHNCEPLIEIIYNEVLILIDEELGQMGGSLSEPQSNHHPALHQSLTSFCDMPQPDYCNRLTHEARVIREEQFDSTIQASKVAKMVPLLNVCQQKAYSIIMEGVYNTSIEDPHFLIDSPGGFGKTFLFQAVSASIRAKGDIILAVASTGLAAQNLEGGRTAHARFKIPIDIKEDSTCNIKVQEALSKLIAASKLIIWDEIFSIHRYCVEAVERTVTDIMNNTKLWGGKATCFGGDPRQTLPVVKRGGRAQIVNACFKSSPLYEKTTDIKLNQNMRADLEEIEFSQYILRLGEGLEDVYADKGEDTIKIPDEYLVPNKEALIAAVFPNLAQGNQNHQELIDGTIYTPLNKNMTDTNNMCMALFPGVEKTYLSADSILEDDQVDAAPVEFLNSLAISGLPDHELTLKVGCPVMLLRNLQGGRVCNLRNGTRMTVIQMMARVLECEVAVGDSKGKRIYLPRIPHYDRSGDFPFTIVRRQFPVRAAFCVTINKGQGQSNERVGMYLPDPVFAHGQLYTGFSRGRRKKDVHVCIEGDDHMEGYTDNIVYKEIIRA